MSKTLTAIAIAKFKPRDRRFEVPDAGARGLYLVVQPSGRTTFCVRYRHGGLPRKLTLQAGISLAAARELCAKAMHEVAQGNDPAKAKLAAKKKVLNARADSVEAVCMNYLCREGPKLRTAGVREATLKRLVFPTIGNTPIESVKRSDLVRLLDKIEDQTGARQADLCLKYLGRVFNWHAARTDEFKSPIVRGMSRYNGKEHERSRVLDDDELRAVWNAAATDGAFGSLVHFLLLTGCRRGEANWLVWSELEGDRWRLPESRNKTKQELERPLSKAAQAIIAAQPLVDGVEFVFTNGNRPLSIAHRKKELDLASGVTGWRLLDLRRTARTLMSRAGVIADIAERCLGHVIGGVRGVYDKHKFQVEMQHAFEALAAQIERIVNPPEGDVVPLRRRARAEP